MVPQESRNLLYQNVFHLARQHSYAVVLGPFLLEEARKNLDGGVEAETDIRLTREAEDRLGRAIVDPTGNLQDQRIRVSHKLGVLENKRLVRVEAHRPKLKNIVGGPLLSLLSRKIPLLLQKLLIIRHLNVHIHMELVLEPLCEVELENMANVHRPTRPSTSIEEETLPLLIIVQHKVQVPVGEEYLPPDKIRRVAQARFETLTKTATYRLGPELADETLIIDYSRYFPGSDYELFLSHFHRFLIRWYLRPLSSNSKAQAYNSDNR